MNLAVSVKDINGTEVRKLELDAHIFAIKPNPGLLHEVIIILQANQRQGTHATKTRALVSGGGKKPFRQKGTGNARQGSNRSPLMRGGAVVHGPQPRSYRRTLPRKMKNLALKVMLSDRLRSGNLHVIDAIPLQEYKTKKICALLQTFGTQKTLLSDARQDDFLYKSARNIYRTEVIDPREINALHIVAHDSLILSTAALQVITTRLSGEKTISGKKALSGKKVTQREASA